MSNERQHSLLFWIDGQVWSNMVSSLELPIWEIGSSPGSSALTYATLRGRNNGKALDKTWRVVTILCVYFKVVDLLVSMCRSALESPRKVVIFEPYPSVVDPNDPQMLAFNPRVSCYPGTPITKFSLTITTTLRL